MSWWPVVAGRTEQHEEASKLVAIHMLAQCYVSEAKHDLAEPLLVEAMEGRTPR